MPLFHHKQKSPSEVCKNLNDLLQTLKDAGEKHSEKVVEDAGKLIQLIKGILSGNTDSPVPPEILAQMTEEIFAYNLLLSLILTMHLLDFESKKDITQIFTALLRRTIGNRRPAVDYLKSKQEILFMLLRSYEHPDVALNCGQILRECSRYDDLATIILDSSDFYRFFEYVQLSSFDVASHSFATFKEFLTRHKVLTSKFLEKDYDKFFDNYTKLLTSDNYVTKRQALKLLGELLLERHNFHSMNRYVNNAENLKLAMILLKDNSKNIQFEAFHVFKVFVANPKKPPGITSILTRNKPRLVDFLSGMSPHDDEQFQDERDYLVKQISLLQSTSP